MVFGLRRSPAPDPIDWTALLSLLEDDDRRAAVERRGRVEGRESYLSALRRLDDEAAEQVLTAGRTLHTAVPFLDKPTVAVAGMLNSGKTSLVATFLSPAGQARSLRGTNNQQGTHRFVLWLPEIWRRDVQLWGLLLSRIGDALGNPPEMLSDEPASAHRQYNNEGGDESSLSVPLVATDPGLDELGIGLLDCPDIVSDASFGLGSPEARRRLLGRSATLCSAFIVVSAAYSSRDATLADLLRIASDLMPGVPRMLAVNMVRPDQTPDAVLESFRPLAQTHGVETVYAAYDYLVPQSRPFIPIIDDQNSASNVSTDGPIGKGVTDEELPTFFSIDPDHAKNPPAAIESNRLLSSLSNQLDRAQLFVQMQRALEQGLETSVWENGFAKIQQDVDRSVMQTSNAQDCLLDATLNFFAHRDVGGRVLELRLHQSPRIVRQLTESFIATAPWYARWSVRINSTVRRVVGGAGDLIRQLTPTGLAKQAANDVKDKFRRGEFGGLMSPELLREAIAQHGGERRLSHWPASEAWMEATEAALSRFERDDFTSLDPKRLDEAVTQMWREVPLAKKMVAGLTPLVALLATFGGVLMIPVDFGANFFLSASVSELFAAAGLTTLAAHWAGGRSTQNVEQQAARQQVSDFHAVLCDTFGVARPENPVQVDVLTAPVNLPPPQIQPREAVGPTLVVYQVREDFRQELQRLLPRPR
ncbi:MAG: hypothetical protein AAGA03_04710 [Planctomycetota bacterium]